MSKIADTINLNTSTPSVLDGTYVVLYNVGSDQELVLDLADDDTSSNPIIGTRYASSSPTQQWRLMQTDYGHNLVWPTFRIKSIHNATVIELDGGKDADGTLVHGRSADQDLENPNQLWYILTGNVGSTDDIIVQIQNLGTKTVLTLPTSSSAPNYKGSPEICCDAAAKLTDRPESVSQLWQLKTIDAPRQSPGHHHPHDNV